jgi:hypothetical protein
VEVTLMGSLIEELEARETAARARVEALEAEIVELGEQVAVPGERDRDGHRGSPKPYFFTELADGREALLDGVSGDPVSVEDDRFDEELLFERLADVALRRGQQGLQLLMVWLCVSV